MTVQADLTRSFRKGLFDGSLPQGVTARAPDEAAARFGVYRNNVTYGLTRALARRYPVVERLVGAEFFAATARLFLSDHPPRDPRLFLWGDAFPAFLNSFRPLRDLPYLPDVARLEWLRGLAYHAADAAPAPAEALARAAADPARFALRLHPSLHLLRSRYAVLSIWQANQPGAVPPDRPLRADQAEDALILRDAADRIPVFPLAPGEASFLAALLRGETLLGAAALAEGADPTPLLSRLVRTRTLIGLIERIAP